MLAAIESRTSGEVQLLILVAAVAAAAAMDIILAFILRRVGKGLKAVPAGSLNRRLRGPVRTTVIVLAVRFVFPLLGLAEQTGKVLNHAFSILIISAVSWLLIKATYVLEDCIVARFDVEQKDNLRARKIQTQFKVLKHIATVVVCIIALGTVLMTFPRVRQLGTTILASAGIIGIVVGMAAQKTIGTFIAGIQIALTQPIRLDDVVIVENEWGRIEEITLSYVVVRIWDLRRLIVPITYFIEKPFQNWTRVTADILGTVYLYVDYTVPVEAIRERLQKVLNESEHWDRKVCVLQVTKTTERSV